MATKKLPSALTKSTGKRIYLSWTLWGSNPFKFLSSFPLSRSPSPPQSGPEIQLSKHAPSGGCRKKHQATLLNQSLIDNPTELFNFSVKYSWGLWQPKFCEGPDSRIGGPSCIHWTQIQITKSRSSSNHLVFAGFQFTNTAITLKSL